MKKIVLSVVTMMMFAVSYAETSESNKFNRQPINYDMSFDMHRLAVKLDLDANQMEAVQVIQDCFNDEVQEAATSRGLKEDDFDKVAEAISLVIKGGADKVEDAKAIIKSLTEKYPLNY